MEETLYCKLEKEELELVKENPHTTQFFCHYGTVSKNNGNIRYKKYLKEKIKGEEPYKNEFTIKNYENEKIERELKEDSKRLDYIEIGELLKSTIYWGQRKLLLSEIDFLTDFGKKGDVIIYAGAATGEHIVTLIDMFPEYEYIGVDPRDFSEELQEKSKDNRIKLTLIKGYFTDDMAIDFSKKYKNILFISDIRTEAVDKDIIENMEAQARWHKLIKARKSMLKLRFPFGENKMKYLDGEIRFQVWEKNESTETRLIIGKKTKEKEYDIRKYEGQLYYFNRVTRCQKYKHNYDIMGMDHCYDCTCELMILEKYLRKAKVETVFKKYKVEVLSMYITQELSHCGRNLFNINKQTYKFIK